MVKRKTTILVVDGEPQTRKMLAIALNSADFSVAECLTGEDAARLCRSLKPDLILLEIDLPDIVGNEVITSIRSWSRRPIIVLTARNSSDDIVTALDLGADDYVIKPFNMNVLQARINANLRQSATGEAGEPELVNGPLRMDLVRHEVYMDGKLVSFTPKEYDLLRYFMVHRGRLLTHRDILHELWGKAHGDNTHYLRIFVKKLRAKLEITAAKPWLFTTLPGIGYRMETRDPSGVRRHGGDQYLI